MNSQRLARLVLSDSLGAIFVDLFNESATFESPLSGSLPEGSIVSYRVIGDALEVDSVVAQAGSANASIYLALSEHGLDPSFSDATLREADELVQSAEFSDPALTDLTKLPFVTIDNVDSMDLDQAMYLSRRIDHGYTLHYALADAAHYVRPGSALFSEALKRGASFYVPGLAVPMLPRALSEGLISLNAGQLRRALVFKIHFDSTGLVVKTTVFQGYIKSAAKLSYSGVEQYYESPETSDLNNQSYTETLELLRELGLFRIAESLQRNVVEYDRSGIEIELQEDNRQFLISDSNRLNVERYNEQISLVCNSEGARLLQASNIPSVVQAVYRIHDAPDQDRLKKFSRLLNGLIDQWQLSPSLWIWRWRDGAHGNKETLAAFLQRLRDAKVDKRLLSAVQRHALMLSPASRFSAVAGEHHSLKLDQYARFSSPMREIAGIYTHRELLQYLSVSDTDELDEFNDDGLREKVIDAANRSKEIQKKLNKAVLKTAIDQLFAPELHLAIDKRSVWTGTVISLRSTRVYVRLDKPAITVKVYLKELSKLTGLTYRLDKSSAFITNQGTGEVLFRLGQELELCAHSYNDDSGRWWVMPVKAQQ